MDAGAYSLISIMPRSRNYSIIVWDAPCYRLGRTVLLTNRMDWTAEQVVAGYSGQQHVEQVFRGLKDGDWLGWGPMYHWTDSKIRVHAFYCMLGISLLQYIHKKSQSAWPGLTMEQMLAELRQIQQFVLLYPPQGEKGPSGPQLCAPNKLSRNNSWPKCSVWMTWQDQKRR